MQRKGDLGRIKISDSCWLLSLLDVSSSSFALMQETAVHEESWSKELTKKEQKNLIFLQSKRKTEES